MSAKRRRRLVAKRFALLPTRKLVRIETRKSNDWLTIEIAIGQTSIFVWDFRSLSAVVIETKKWFCNHLRVVSLQKSICIQISSSLPRDGAIKILLYVLTISDDFYSARLVAFISRLRTFIFIDKHIFLGTRLETILFHNNSNRWREKNFGFSSIPEADLRRRNIDKWASPLTIFVDVRYPSISTNAIVNSGQRPKKVKIFPRMFRSRRSNRRFQSRSITSSPFRGNNSMEKHQADRLLRHRAITFHSMRLLLLGGLLNNLNHRGNLLPEEPHVEPSLLFLFSKELAAFFDSSRLYFRLSSRNISWQNVLIAAEGSKTSLKFYFYSPLIARAWTFVPLSTLSSILSCIQYNSERSNREAATGV